MTLKKARKFLQAFTIVEMMVASAILIIAILGFTAAYLAAMRTHRMAYHHDIAVTLAKNRLQRAWSLDYVSLPLLSESTINVDSLGAGDPGGEYSRTTVVDTNYLPGVTLIRVLITFPDGRRGGTAPEAVELTTMLTPDI